MTLGIRKLNWLGDTKEIVRAFPESARLTIGHDLYLIEQSEQPNNWKPMTTVGRGVRELRAKDSGNIFRTIYVVKKTTGIWILHAFAKKSQKTAQKDINLAKQRLKEVE